jgi:5-methylcytosine-specific restriction endonuclease McrBC regulatory subunit McrC
MLCQVNSINVFDLPYSQGNVTALDLLMLLFPYYLSNALQQGLYKEYRTFHHNDSNVRVVIDINRHIQRNIPFQGNVAYRERVKTVDNALTQLIRHTIEYISKHPIGMALLHRNADIRGQVLQIIEATPSYSQKDRTKIISDNLRPKVHPYYSEYRPLQQLCLQILHQEDISMGKNSEYTYGILFDGAWLWEEYLSTLLSKEGFTHPQNKSQKGSISLFMDNSGKRYPDFYHAESKIVLDAKYKCLERATKVSDVERNDIHQVISYMHVLSSNIGGLLYPSKAESSTMLIQSTLKGYGGTMILFPIHIPVVDNWNDFIQQIKVTETRLINDLIPILRN